MGQGDSAPVTFPILARPPPPAAMKPWGNTGTTRVAVRHTKPSQGEESGTVEGKTNTNADRGCSLNTGTWLYRCNESWRACHRNSTPDNYEGASQAGLSGSVTRPGERTPLQAGVAEAPRISRPLFVHLHAPRSHNCDSPFILKFWFYCSR